MKKVFRKKRLSTKANGSYTHEEDQEHRNGVIGRLCFEYDSKEALHKGLKAVDSGSEDSEYLQERAAEENATRGYEPQYTGQEAVQEYLAGRATSADGVDVKQLSACNTLLYKGEKPADVQAQELLYSAKQGDFNKVFSSVDPNVYEAMEALLSNGEIPDCKTVEDLYNKAMEQASDQEKPFIQANAVLSGKINFSQDEITEICIDLMHAIDFNKGAGSSTGVTAAHTNDAEHQTQQLQAILTQHPEIIANVRQQVEEGTFESSTRLTMGAGSSGAVQSTEYKTDNKQAYLDLIDNTNYIAEDSVFLDAEGNQITDPQQIEELKNKNLESLSDLREYVAELEREFKMGVDAEGWLDDAGNSLVEYSGIGTDRGDVENNYREAKRLLTQLEAAAEGKLRDSDGNVVSAQDLAQKFIDENHLQEANADYKSSVGMAKMGIVLAPVIVATTVATMGTGATGWAAVGVGAAATGTTEGLLYGTNLATSETGNTAENRASATSQVLQDTALAAVGIKVGQYAENFAVNGIKAATAAERQAFSPQTWKIISKIPEGKTKDFFNAAAKISSKLEQGVADIGASAISKQANLLKKAVPNISDKALERASVIIARAEAAGIEISSDTAQSLAQMYIVDGEFNEQGFIEGLIMSAAGNTIGHATNVVGEWKGAGEHTPPPPSGGILDVATGKGTHQTGGKFGETKFESAKGQVADEVQNASAKRVADLHHEADLHQINAGKQGKAIKNIIADNTGFVQVGKERIDIATADTEALQRARKTVASWENGTRNKEALLQQIDERLAGKAAHTAKSSEVVDLINKQVKEDAATILAGEKGPIGTHSLATLNDHLANNLNTVEDIDKFIADIRNKVGVDENGNMHVYQIDGKDNAAELIQRAKVKQQQIRAHQADFSGVTERIDNAINANKGLSGEDIVAIKAFAQKSNSIEELEALIGKLNSNKTLKSSQSVRKMVKDLDNKVEIMKAKSVGGGSKVGGGNAGGKVEGGNKGSKVGGNGVNEYGQKPSFTQYTDDEIVAMFENKPLNSGRFRDIIEENYTDLRRSGHYSEEGSINGNFEDIQPWNYEPSAGVLVTGGIDDWIWHRMDNGCKFQGNDRVSLSVKADKNLMQELDQLLLTGTYKDAAGNTVKIPDDKFTKGFYKTDITIDDWCTRHDPITMYFDETASEEMMQAIATVTDKYKRIPQRELTGAVDGKPWIAHEPYTTAQEVADLVAEARKLNPELADAIHYYCLDHGEYNASTGMYNSCKKLLDDYKQYGNIKSGVGGGEAAVGNAGHKTSDVITTKDGSIVSFGGDENGNNSGFIMTGGKPEDVHLDNNIGEVVAGGATSAPEANAKKKGFFSKIGEKLGFIDNTPRGVANREKIQNAINNGLLEAIDNGQVDPQILNKLDMKGGDATSDASLGYSLSNRLGTALAQQKQGIPSVKTLPNGTKLSDIAQHIESGDVCSIDGKLYVNLSGNAIPIKMSQENFERLFDTMKLATMRQDSGTFICQYTATINGMLETPAGRARLFSMIEETDGGMIVNLKNGKTPVFFPGGKPVNMKGANFMTDAPDGIKMLEQAFFTTNLKKAAEGEITDIREFSLNSLIEQSKGNSNRRTAADAILNLAGTISTRAKTSELIKNGNSYSWVMKDTAYSDVSRILDNFRPGRDVLTAHWGGHARTIVDWDSKLDLVTYRDPMSSGIDIQCTFTQLMNKGRHAEGLFMDLTKEENIVRQLNTNPTTNTEVTVPTKPAETQTREVTPPTQEARATKTDAPVQKSEVSQPENDAKPVQKHADFQPQTNTLSLKEMIAIGTTIDGNPIRAQRLVDGGIMIEKNGKYKEIKASEIQKGESVPVLDKDTGIYMIFQKDARGNVTVTTSLTPELDTPTAEPAATPNKPTTTNTASTQTQTSQPRTTTTQRAESSQTSSTTNKPKPLEIPRGFREYTPIWGKRTIINANNEVMIEKKGQWVKFNY